MGIIKKMIRLYGRCTLRITGTYTETILNRCMASCVDILYAEKESEYVLLLEIRESDLETVTAIAKHSMCEYEVKKIRGGSSFLKFMKRHIWLFAAAASVTVLVFFSSLYVWEIRVTGNVKLSDGEILRALSECGVDIGTYRPDVKNDIVRSKMILKLPKIAWLSVNFNGSRATVLVAERLEKPKVYNASAHTDVVSKADGIVRSVRALNGTALVSRGQSVVKGEKLIDGRIDSINAFPRFVNAFGSVIAQTRLEKTAVAPVKIQKKTEHRAARNRFALKAGKSRINFYLNAGNTVDECDKIIHNYKIGMKGIFSFPLSIVHEIILPYKTETAEIRESEILRKRLSDKLREEIEGEVLSESASQSTDGELLTVTVRCECLENIAETTKRETEDDRTDNKS